MSNTKTPSSQQGDKGEEDEEEDVPTTSGAQGGKKRKAAQQAADKQPAAAAAAAKGKRPANGDAAAPKAVKKPKQQLQGKAPSNQRDLHAAAAVVEKPGPSSSVAAPKQADQRAKGGKGAKVTGSKHHGPKHGAQQGGSGSKHFKSNGASARSKGGSSSKPMKR